MTITNNNPRSKQPKIYGAVIFAKAVFRGSISLKSSWKNFATSIGIILGRWRGSLLHEMFWASPTQNSLVPSEQFLGIKASSELGIAVLAALAALWT